RGGKPERGGKPQHTSKPGRGGGPERGGSERGGSAHRVAKLDRVARLDLAESARESAKESTREPTKDQPGDQPKDQPKERVARAMRPAEVLEHPRPSARKKPNPRRKVYRAAGLAAVVIVLVATASVTIMRSLHTSPTIPAHAQSGTRGAA